MLYCPVTALEMTNMLILPVFWTGASVAEKVGISVTAFVCLKIEPYIHLDENVFYTFKHILYSSAKMSLKKKQYILTQSSSNLIEKL